ncbi:MAG: hypothetical protein WAM85_12710 [Terracidiphilus sp.]
MLFPQLQIAAFMMAGLYLAYSRNVLHDRNLRTWDSMVAKLQPAVVALRGLSTPQIHAAIAERHEHIRSGHDVRAMHRSSGAMLEMADYAERNGDSVDPALLGSLRSDAIHIRIGTAKALALNVCFRWNR